MNQLTLISGKVDNLKITNGYDNFVFSQKGQTATGAVATGAVAMGSFFSGAVMANAGISSRETVEFFTCTVDGLPVAGRFKQISFNNGDDLEFVVEYTNRDQEAAIAHAVRDTKQRLLWVIPEQERGTIAKKKDNIWMAKMFAGFTAIIAFLLMIALGFSVDFNDAFIWLLIIFAPLITGGGAFLMGILTTRHFIKHAEKANKVIAALGYDNPEKVDLMENQLKAGAKLRAKNKLIKRSDFTSIRY